MTNKLFNILDGIIGSEYKNEILADTVQIQDYAAACEEEITIGEAKKIQSVGRTWLHEMDNGNGEWSRMRHEAMAALEAE